MHFFYCQHQQYLVYFWNLWSVIRLEDRKVNRHSNRSPVVVFHVVFLYPSIFFTDLRKNQQSISLDPPYLRWWQQMAFLPGSRWTAQPHLWRQTKAIFSLWTLTSLWVQEIKKLNKYFKNPSPSPLALTSRCPKYISTFLSFLCITITTCSSAPLLPITVGCYVCAPQSLNLICSLHKLI